MKEKLKVFKISRCRKDGNSGCKRHPSSFIIEAQVTEGGWLQSSRREEVKYESTEAGGNQIMKHLGKYSKSLNSILKATRSYLSEKGDSIRFRFLNNHFGGSVKNRFE